MLLKLCTLMLFSVGFALGDQMDPILVDLYLDAKPLHIEIRTPDAYIPESRNQAKFTTNEPYSGFFTPLADCSANRTDLKMGDYGSVSSPNYPRNYPANMACEWRLEGPPGSRIEAVFFDVYTQPWFFAYFDYLMVARNGNFSSVDRMSGDMNGKTPMVVVSEENVLGIRFRSSSLFNFRGFKAQYLVVPNPDVEQDPGTPPVSERPVFDGVCGQPSAASQLSTTSVAPDELSSSSEAGPTEDTVIVSTEASTEASTPQQTDIPVIIGNGSARAIPDEHIIGGSETLKYAYPWMAALLIDNKHFCGGSLIDDQHVMTAAHCTSRASAVTILLGTHNIKSKPGTEDSRKIFNITRENIFQHPDYNENTISHDISILRLPEKVTFTDRIKPVCLPNRQQLASLFTDAEARVSGWGKPADNAPGVSPFLKEADVRVMPNSQCRVAFRGIVTGNLICIATTRTASPCKGDSGGPLMIKEESPSGPYFTQLGIVSFGSLTCEKGLPVGFTRVTAFMDYISEVTGRQL